MFRPAVVCCLVVCVTTAGCGSLVAEETATREPFSVPETTEPLTDGQLVPGLWLSGALDAAELADSHRAVVGADSRTVRRVQTVSDPNGTRVGRVTTTLRVGENGTALYTVVTTGDTHPALGLDTDDRTVWTNGSVTLVRAPDGTVFFHEVRRDLPGDETGARFVGQYLARATDVTVETRYWNGDSYYGVNASLLPTETTVLPTETTPGDESTGGKLEAAVVTEGAVARLTVRESVTVEGEPVARVTHQLVGAVGGTRVERPDWVVAALDERTDGTGPSNVSRGRRWRTSDRPSDGVRTQLSAVSSPTRSAE
ncbi:hypothetical protein [Haloarchaeobius sp. TZWWS8]|uniref:hypothetical protein n=1 Tax=Haloarchaeobius sp. TZWWS8 TaxID=3446121 RepID=UPI003EBF4D17